MKRFFALMVAATVSCSSLLAVQKDTVRVLSIGNSFSEDAVEDHLYSLAAREGVTLIIGNMFIPGCSLETHASNMKTDAPEYSYRKVSADGVRTVTWGDPLSMAVGDEEWDYVTLQQASHFSGKADTYMPYLKEMCDYINERCPSAEILFHMTWAYDPDTVHKAFADYGSDQMTMYRAILDAVDHAVGEVGIKRVIPCGTAVQNVRTTVLEDKVNKEDGFHLSVPHGRYLAGCVWCEFLLGCNVRGNSYCPDGMTPEECLLMQKAAHAAVRRPCAITKIK